MWRAVAVFTASAAGLLLRYILKRRRMADDIEMQDPGADPGVNPPADPPAGPVIPATPAMPGVNPGTGNGQVPPTGVAPPGGQPVDPGTGPVGSSRMFMNPQPNPQLANVPPEMRATFLAFVEEYHKNNDQVARIVATAVAEVLAAQQQSSNNGGGNGGAKAKHPDRYEGLPGDHEQHYSVHDFLFALSLR